MRKRLASTDEAASLKMKPLLLYSIEARKKQATMFTMSCPFCLLCFSGRKKSAYNSARNFS
jgi:hypothetical protein